MKYGFAGNRNISVGILRFLVNEGYYPSFLILNSSNSATHNNELIKLSQLNPYDIYEFRDLKNDRVTSLLKYEVNYIFGIHFPFKINKVLLDLPTVGFLNLHPAYLPFNKGWHTPSWAIIDKTIYGATLHFMSEKLDCGDIVAQEVIKILPNDTANCLYKKVLELEKIVFIKAFPDLLTLNPRRIRQSIVGTSHSKKDLSAIQEINTKEKILPLEFIDILRALTTNDIDESAFFEIEGKRYHVQVKIVESNEFPD